MRQQWVHTMAWYLQCSRDTAFNYRDGKPDFAVGIYGLCGARVYEGGEKGSDTLASHLAI